MCRLVSWLVLPWWLVVVVVFEIPISLSLSFPLKGKGREILFLVDCLADHRCQPSHRKPHRCGLAASSKRPIACLAMTRNFRVNYISLSFLTLKGKGERYRSFSDLAFVPGMFWYDCGVAKMSHNTDRLSEILPGNHGDGGGCCIFVTAWQ